MSTIFPPRLRNRLGIDPKLTSLNDLTVPLLDLRTRAAETVQPMRCDRRPNIHEVIIEWGLWEIKASVGNSPNKTTRFPEKN